MKTIVITGVDTGFGMLISKTLADEAHNVIAAMTDIQGKNRYAMELFNQIDNVEVVEMDTACDQSIRSALERISGRYGRIDVLINNAEQLGFGLVEATSLEEIKRIFEVNFFGVLRTYQHMLPYFRITGNGGLVINISSDTGIFAVPFLVPYSASKSALEAVSEGINSELRQFGIENVSIQCGSYLSDFTLENEGFCKDPELAETYGESCKQEFRKFGNAMRQKIADSKMNPQDVADAVLKIIDMKKGTRPLQYPVDGTAKKIDEDYLDIRKNVREIWLDTKYNFLI